MDPVAEWDSSREQDRQFRATSGPTMAVQNPRDERGSVFQHTIMLER